MDDQLNLFGEKTSAASSAATSSQESADGSLPSSSQGSQRIESLGLAPRLVSHFPLQASEEALRTSVTSGLFFDSLSPSAVLQRSLESRLLQRMAAIGSLEFDLTWKRWDMQSGGPICALVASEPVTSDSASSGAPAGWTTPSATDGERGGKEITPGISGSSLTQQAPLAGWPTPRTPTGGPETAARKQELGRTESGGSDLQAVALLSGWRTPTGQDRDQVRGEGKAAEASKRGTTLGGAARLCGWASPAARDYRYPNTKSFKERGGEKKGEQLSNQVIHGGRPLASGTLSILRIAVTDRSVVLNPGHSRWLMGYPAEWDSASPGWAEWSGLQERIERGDFEDTGTPSTPGLLPSS